MRSLCSFFTPLLALVWFSSPLVQASYSVLEPDPVHQETLKSLAKTLRFGHYKKRYLDDELSSELLDLQLERLDPSRLYFLQSDIDEFEQYRHRFDDAIRAGDSEPAFTIYNRYQQRATERLNFMLGLIEQGLDKLDFERDEQIVTERSEAPWPTDHKEQDQLWRKRLKSLVLNLKLSDKTLEEAAKTLSRRYNNQLHRLSQSTAEDAFGVFANSYAGLFDPHTQYFSPRLTENFNINMRLSLEGIGAVLQIQDEHTRVVRLVPAGPADKQGQLKPSDLITGVGQGEVGEIVDVVGWRLDEVVELIRGPKGSTVRLQVSTAEDKGKNPKIIRIVRNKVKLEEQAAQKKLLELERDGQPYKLGVISIPTFYIDFRALQAGDPDYRSTTRDVERLLGELIDEGAQGLIIDLRNNGGGSLKESVELTGLFIPQGPVVQIKDAWGRIRVESDHNPKFFDIPLAVMVNRLSASASEIFAGAIKDYNRGLVIGSQTYGKGTVQALFPLNHGQLKLTQQMFYRISGTSTQNKGVTPHISLPGRFDISKVGESSEHGALAWDQVKALPHKSSQALSQSQLAAIEQRHHQRANTEPDLIALKEEFDHRLQRQRDSLPLNEQALRELRERTEAEQLQIENRRRHAKNLPQLGSLAELQAEQPVNDEIDLEQDALLREGTEILIDLLSIQTTAMH
ncbi:carboxy terminal-processing peptidase [Motiliproteus sp.]|uniref:carboxy terminal-processing peptidase n=1 Tax=Motiliproteus sp. TaxID=1898955 RepID=UPI003BA866AD